MSKSCGWYTFADGACIWFNALSAQEKREQIREHGAIVAFERS